MSREAEGAAEGPERARRALLATLRQELRAPVSAILEYSSMLMEDVAALEDEDLTSDVSRIATAGRRLQEVVDELLATGAVGGDGVEELGSDIRHELRTPLNHVLGYAEMILEEAEALGAARLVPDLKRIVAAGRTLLGRIDDLVRLSRVEAGQEDLDESFTAAFLVQEVVAALEEPERVRSEAEEAGSILVVDDNELNRDLLARRLERQGHEVVTAADGREALARVREGSFDLVLLDMMMPGLNGYQVLERLKGDEALRHIPVIMITAFGEIEAVVRCVELGAEDYLTKPFNPVLLDARIGASLEKKRLRDREVLYLRRIEQEQRRSDRLLRVILPDEIVEELKATNRVAPRRHDDVAVLFTDVVGFTRYCDAREPEEVVTALQELVDRFETICEAHGLEKIKTIGDAFMAAAGLLTPVENPVLPCVRAGLEMAGSTNSAGWRVRVGIHCGEVVAGVVGRKKYLFDLWGDAVNTAARMESSGVAGGVTVSRAAWDRVAHQCRGASRGTVPVKGKGDMEIFQVKGLSG